MKVLLLLTMITMSHQLSAQTSTSIDIVAPGGTNGYGSVNISNPSEIGTKKTIEIDGSNVSGSAFWKNDWNKAFVFLQSGGVVKLKGAKLNLNTGETYFLDDNGILKAADIGSINKIIFLDKTDSLQTLAVFQKLVYNGANSFFQVLNGGEFQLLKSTQISLRRKEYDPMVGKDEFSYDAKSTYYLLHGGNLSALTALNKNALASLLPFSNTDNNWLAANNNKLKKEADFIAFLNYRGGQK